MEQFKVVAHLTSVHPRHDTRIFLKECAGVAAAGYQTHLVVADAKGDDFIDGINIHDVGRAGGGRFGRMAVTTLRVFRKAINLKADIYHFHDPELIPIGLLLKLCGKVVVYDVHEDLAKQLLEKTWIRPKLRKFISVCCGFFEKSSASIFDAVCAATPSIAEGFKAKCRKCVVVNNFPILGELYRESFDVEKAASVAYVGVITERRGIIPLVTSMASTSLKLELMGEFRGDGLKDEVVKLAGWCSVNDHGVAGREKVGDILSSAMAGVVTFLPEPNHIEAQPNKMFEYMSAGIAVVSSDFPLWKEFVEGNECGICVDPEDSQAIAQALNYLSEHPDVASQMGRNGRRAVESKYNWSLENEKLLSLYQSLL